MKATLTSRYMAGSVLLRWSGFQWMTHTLFSISKDPSNTDGQMRCVEKLHDEVSVFDCLNHLLICVHVSVAMEAIQWKIQQEHVRISLVSEGPQYDHCLSFLVHVWLSLVLNELNILYTSMPRTRIWVRLLPPWDESILELVLLHPHSVTREGICVW